MTSTPHPARRGGERVLLRRRGRARTRGASDLQARSRDRGRVRAPFKCPPAPSEAALLLHDYLSERGIRDDVPDHPRDAVRDTGSTVSRHVGRAPRGLRRARHRVRLGPARGFTRQGAAPRFDDGSELPYDLFLGVPKHRAPDVVLESGMAEDGYIPVDSRTLETRFPGVYAVGDVATVGVPKAGVFSEGARAGVVAASLIAQRQGGEQADGFDGRGSCYVEFGAGEVGRVDVDSLSGPKPTGHLPGALAAAGRRETALRSKPSGPCGFGG